MVDVLILNKQKCTSRRRSKLKGRTQMRDRKKCVNKRANKRAAVAEIVPSQGATSQSVISFADAVSEGRDLITVMNGEERRIQLRLGELYARVERK